MDPPYAVASDPRLMRRGHAHAPVEGRYNFSATFDAEMAAQQQQRDAVDAYHIPLAYAVKSAEDCVTYETLFKDFVLFIFLIVPFVFFVLVGFDTRTMFFLGENVAGLPANRPIPPRDTTWPPTVGPTWGASFHDIQTAADWYWWAESLLSFYFDAANPDTAHPEGFPLAGNTLLVGALRFRVLRVASDSCTASNRFGSYMQDVCFGEAAAGFNTSQLGPFPYFTCPHPFITKTEARTYFFDCGGNILDIPFALSYNAALALFRTLLPSASLPSGFIDEGSTRLVAVSAVAFSPSSQYFALTHLLVDFTQGGVLLPEASFQPFEVWSRNYVFGSAYLIVYFIVTLGFIARFWWNVLTARHKLQHMLSFWTILELINLGVLFVMFVCRFVWWGQSSRESFQLRPNLSSFPNGLEYVATLYVLQQRLNSINTVLIFLQILKYTPLSAGLAVVSRSIFIASTNIIGLLVIFVVVLLAYSIAGNALFGGRMSDFRDISTAFSTNMRMLIGDSDFSAMQEIDLYLAGLYFWTFLIIGLFLLLNFIIAVIGDAFDSDSGADDGSAMSVHDELVVLAGNIQRAVRRLVRDPRSFFQGTVASARTRWGRDEDYHELRQALREEIRTGQDSVISGLKELQSIVAENKVAGGSSSSPAGAAPATAGHKAKAGAVARDSLSEAFVEEFWHTMVARFMRLESVPARVRALAHEKRIRTLTAEALGTALAKPDGSSTLTELLQPAGEVLTALQTDVQPALRQLSDLINAIVEEDES